MFRNLSEVWECAFLEEDRVWDAKELAVEKKKVKKSHKNVMRELLRQFTEQGDADAVEPELEAEEEGNEEESAPQQQSQPTQEPVATSQAPKVEDPLERMLREVMSKIEVPVVVARRPPSTESSQSALSQPTLSTPSSLTTPATEEIVPPSELQTEKGPEAATEVSKQEEQAVVAIEPKITLPEPESEPKITLPEPQPQPQSEPEPEGPNADPAEEEELLLLLLAQEQASAADSRLEDDLMGSEDKQISGGKYTKDEYIDLYQDSPITTNAPSIGEDSSPLPSQTRSGRSSKSVSFFSDS